MLVLATLALGGAAVASAEISQKGKLRVKVTAKLSPRTLPRQGAAPISVFFSGRISTSDQSDPPQLKQMRIELNRNGRIDYRGLPICRVKQIHPASSGRALAACRRSLVGKGTFWGDVVLAGQEPYPTKGRLLVFYGKRKGQPALLGQVYSGRPFATSFVIPFEIKTIRKGIYGTGLIARLPRSLGSWGYVTAIEMTLSRRYVHRGKRHSFISAGCPAPKGFPGAVFTLARTNFRFAGGQQVGSRLRRSCGVRR